MSQWGAPIKDFAKRADQIRKTLTSFDPKAVDRARSDLAILGLEMLDAADQGTIDFNHLDSQEEELFTRALIKALSLLGIVLLLKA